MASSGFDRIKRAGKMIHQPMSATPLRSLIPGGLIGAILLSGGCSLLRNQVPTEPVYPNATQRAGAQTAVLHQAWKMVNKRFYSPDFNGADWATAYDRHRPAAAQATSQAELYAVINQMLDELADGHTGAKTPQQRWEDMQSERAFVGLNLERVDEQWVVSELRPGSAAAESVVKPGWIATTRNGEDLPEDSLTFRSEPGVTYDWSFLDAENAEHTISLVARTLPDWMPPQEWHSPEGWIYLRFDEFEPEYHKWLRGRLQVHREAPGIVLDLRSNSGGSVASLEHVINDFFPQRVAYGTFVSRQGRRDHEKSAWRDGEDYGGGLVVLIGGGSASSAEILAHVFQHYERATLIGRPTAGVVVASRFFPLRDGGELQIGLHDFQTLDGSRLEGKGVQPDVEVARTLTDLREGHDADLAAAVEWLRAHVPLPQSVRL